MNVDPMADDPKVLAKLERSAQRLERAEDAAGKLRNELYEEMRAAKAAGTSLSGIARAVGVSRQRVQKFFAPGDPPAQP